MITEKELHKLADVSEKYGAGQERLRIMQMIHDKMASMSAMSRRTSSPEELKEIAFAIHVLRETVEEFDGRL